MSERYKVIDLPEADLTYLVADTAEHAKAILRDVRRTKGMTRCVANEELPGWLLLKLRRRMEFVLLYDESLMVHKLERHMHRLGRADEGMFLKECERAAKEKKTRAYLEGYAVSDAVRLVAKVVRDGGLHRSDKVYVIYEGPNVLVGQMETMIDVYCEPETSVSVDIRFESDVGQNLTVLQVEYPLKKRLEDWGITPPRVAQKLGSFFLLRLSLFCYKGVFDTQLRGVSYFDEQLQRNVYSCKLPCEPRLFCLLGIGGTFWVTGLLLGFGCDSKTKIARGFAYGFMHAVIFGVLAMPGILMRMAGNYLSVLIRSDLGMNVIMRPMQEKILLMVGAMALALLVMMVLCRSRKRLLPVEIMLLSLCVWPTVLALFFLTGLNVWYANGLLLSQVLAALLVGLALTVIRLVRRRKRR